MNGEYAAVAARLREHPGLAGKVFDSIRETDAGELVRTNYVVLFGGVPDFLGDQRLTKGQDKQSNATFYFDVKVVGVTRDACSKMVGEAMDQLLRFTPTVVGRKCWPMTFDSGSKIGADTAVKPALFFCDMTFELRSDRA